MAEEKGHLRILAEEVTGVSKIYAVSPDGDQFLIGGIQSADIELSLDASVLKTLNLRVIVETADIVTLRKSPMK